MEPRILAIETATTACSVALSCNGEIYHHFEIVPQLHTQRIFPMIRLVLDKAGIELSSIDAIAVGRGPGSFTGLRIAVSVAQGLGYGLNKPVYPVSTLEAMALQARENMRPQQTLAVLTSLDARMQEVYAAIFRVSHSNITTLTPEHIISIEHFNAWKNEYAEPLLHLECLPRAQEVAIVALEAWKRGEQGLRAEDVLPVYLRDKVAEIPKSK